MGSVLHGDACTPPRIRRDRRSVILARGHGGDRQCRSSGGGKLAHQLRGELPLAVPTTAAAHAAISEDESTPKGSPRFMPRSETISIRSAASSAAKSTRRDAPPPGGVTVSRGLTAVGFGPLRVSRDELPLV